MRWHGQAGRDPLQEVQGSGGTGPQGDPQDPGSRRRGDGPEAQAARQGQPTEARRPAGRSLCAGRGRRTPRVPPPRSRPVRRGSTDLRGGRSRYGPAGAHARRHDPHPDPAGTAAGGSSALPAGDWCRADPASPVICTSRWMSRFRLDSTRTSRPLSADSRMHCLPMRTPGGRHSTRRSRPEMATAPEGCAPRVRHDGPPRRAHVLEPVSLPSRPDDPRCSPPHSSSRLPCSSFRPAVASDARPSSRRRP